MQIEDSLTSIKSAPHRKDEKYYFDDGTIFLVKGVLFRIPKMMFQVESTVFRDMFTLPAHDPGPSTSIIEGRTESNPIRIPDVSDVDFRNLLTYLYPLTTRYTTFMAYWDHAKWMSILTLADRFMMDDIKNEAIRSIDKLDNFPSSIDKIVSGNKFHSKWVREGYKELVLRQSPLTADEGSKLGVKHAMLCAATREKYIRDKSNVNLVGGRVQQGWGSALFPPDSLQNIDGAYLDILLDGVFGNAIPRNPMPKPAAALSTIFNSIPPQPVFL